MTERSFRLPRKWSNAVLRTIAPCYDGDVINVSGWDDRDKEGSRYREYFTRAARYYISNHTGERGTTESDRTDFQLDLTAPLPAALSRRFDVVYNHTTLEHIFDVHTAFRNLCELTRDSAIVVVPFAQELHYTPSYGDYWRFTPMGLRELFSRNGLAVVFESATPYWRSGLYLLFVGSRAPERWRDVLPPFTPVDVLGRGISGGLLQHLALVIRRPRTARF